MRYSKSIRGMAAAGIFMCAGMVQAANIQVADVATVTGAPAGQTDVQFDISWDASWRAGWVESGSWTNWDAAWVFVKYREDGATSWSHATLSASADDHSAPAGSTIDVGLTGADGMGVFLYRSAEGAGSWTNTGVKLRWNYADDGLASAAQVDICVHAIEMVYVPEGAYDLGDGDGSGESVNAFHVTQNTKVRIDNTLVTGITMDANAYDDAQIEGTGIGIDGDEGLDADGNGVVDNPDFPTGYTAFYCMKYEASQEQYADFLNQLTSTHASARFPNMDGSDRHEISGTHPAYTSAAPDRACNYLTWNDARSYTDWAALRPMTELEFEKACRGPLAAAKFGYAWGNTTIDNIESFSGDDGSGTETPGSASENAAAVGGISGPVRCGIFADATSGRTESGSTYWGIMEMSGNIIERAITVGNSTGRDFTGLHGNGELSGSGAGDVVDWPLANSTGTGWRGGAWGTSTDRLRLSDRFYGAYADSARKNGLGVRCVRTAP